MRRIVHRITCPSGARIELEGRFLSPFHSARIKYSGDVQAFLKEAGLPPHYFDYDIDCGCTFERGYDHLKDRGFTIETVSDGEWQFYER